MSRRTALLVALVAGAVALGPSPARAEEGPSIRLARDELRPGDRVLVTLEGWSPSTVTVTVCGNLARRGSADCNLTGSQAVAVRSASTPMELVVTPPSVTCPCAIRASSTANEEVAVVPIELIGAPVGPVVDPAAPTTPVLLGIDVRRDADGWLTSARSWLGGPTRYSVTVTVHNTGPEPVEGMALAGSARRGGDDVAAVELPAVPPLEPGERWEHTVHADVPAPAIGTTSLEVTASGGGGSVVAAQELAHRPVGLVIVTALLVVDLVAIAARRLARRRASVAETAPSAAPA